MLVVEGIDEVGPDLERLHDQAAPAEGANQPERDAGLADAAVGAGDDDRAQGRASSLLVVHATANAIYRSLGR
ncbi:MAG TPA: hypothetical protein VGK68_07390 [Gaiellaceae bacterium]